jgi:hypothetical protein
MKKILIILLLVLTLCTPACSKKSVESGPSNSETFIDSEKSQRGKDSYLSYEHFFTIDTTNENLPKIYKETVDACINNEKYKCTILDSRISTGEYQSAYIKLRIVPEGVKNILNVASNNGKLIQESTHIEDLAKPIVDNNQRLDMLKSHYNRLIELQEKASNDIDSLIKVSSEISKVQSEIEAATGEKEFLHQKVSMDIVNFDFQVEYYRSFWRPIRESLSDFSNNLSDGISGTIIAVAYLFPVIMIILLVFFAVRFLWKKVHKNK